MNVIETLKQIFQEIAPEADLERIDREKPIRDEIDLDSMDQFQILLKIHKRLGINIPTTDYPQISTLRGLIEYLEKK